MSIKILHIINNLGTGGAEKLLVETLPLYSALEKKIDTDLLLLNGEQTPFRKRLDEIFSGKVISLGNGSVYNPLHIFRLLKYMSEYDIIHVHLFPALYFVSIAKFITRSKVKLLFTEHSTNNKRAESSFFRMIDRIIYKNYSVITAITPEVKFMLEHKLKLQNNIIVVYNGIDAKRIMNARPILRSDFFEQEDARILIQVSRFSVQKDQKTLIKALSLLPESVKLLLVGDGELKYECVHLVSELKLAERVRFLGVRMDIPELLKTSDIVIQSSVWEGFGLAAVEGMAAGKPVIASDVSGLKEVVDGAGLLFLSTNEKDLARQVNSLLDNDLLYKQIAGRCLERSQKFDVKNMVEHVINIYKKCLIQN